jgi:hypothetical protein
MEQVGAPLGIIAKRLSATDLNNGDAVVAESGRSAVAVAVLVRRLGLEKK